MTPERSPCDTLREHRLVWRSPTEVAAEIERLPLLERRLVGLAVYGWRYPVQDRLGGPSGDASPLR